MAECKDCIHYCVCSPYTAPSETYPEVGGCGCFKPTTDYIPKEFLTRKEDEAYERGYKERCEDCKANKVCDHNEYGFENCGNYIPKSEEDNSCDSCACKLLDERDDARREVDRLQAEKDALIKNYSECMKDYARGIFEEIEKVAIIGEITGNVKILSRYYAELKKKYTEEKC